MNKKDLEQISQVMDSRLDSKLTPVHLMLQRHEQTLYGATGDNGLNKDVEALGKRMSTVEKFQIKVATALGVATTGLTLFGESIRKKVGL